MQRLEKLITRLGAATVAEINQAIFAHSGSGIIEALYFECGEDKEREVLTAVAGALEIPFLRDVDIVVEESVLRAQCAPPPARSGAGRLRCPRATASSALRTWRRIVRSPEATSPTRDLDRG